VHATSFHIQMLLFKATLETCRRDLFVCFARVHGEVWLIFNELCFSLFFLSLLYLSKYKGVLSFTFCIQFDFHSFDCYLFCFFFNFITYHLVSFNFFNIKFDPHFFIVVWFFPFPNWILFFILFLNILFQIIFISNLVSVFYFYYIYIYVFFLFFFSISLLNILLT